MVKKKIALMTYAIDGRQAKGTALYARKLTEQLLLNESNGYEFVLVHFEKTDDPIYDSGASELLIPEIPFRLPYGTRFVRFLLFCWKYRKDKFDIIHWFQPRMYPFFWWAPARKIVVTVHAAGDITAPRSFRSFSRAVFNTVLILFNRYVDAMLAVSEFARQEIIQEYKVPPEKVHVTYNGGGEEYAPQDGKQHNEVLEKYNVTSPYILSVARFQPHKNVESIVRAFDQAKDRLSRSAHQLILVGAPVKGYAGVEKAVSKAKYKQDIKMVSYVAQADLNTLYSQASVFVFVSLNEGFGLPVIEAMASGTPVITANVTSMPEIAGDAAVLVDPTNIDLISTEIQNVITSPERQEILRRKGLQRASNFTWSETAQRTLEVYNNLLK